MALLVARSNGLQGQDSYLLYAAFVVVIMISMNYVRVEQPIEELLQTG